MSAFYNCNSILIEESFDSVNHNVLIHLLKESGFDQPLLSLDLFLVKSINGLKSLMLSLICS